MKRIGTVAVSFLAVGCLLNGCALGDTAQMDGAVQNSDFAKAQEITAVRVGEDVPVYTATEKEHIETFVEQMQIDEWKIGTLPEDAEASVVYSFQQEKTVLFGESSTDGSMDELLKFTVYVDAPYLSLEVLGQSLHFQIPEDAANYLNHPEEIESIGSGV